MTEEKYTRCPGCRTVFRVTPAQLALREGQVRCGHCRTVFDGTANLIRLSATASAPMDEDANGPLTVTLRSAQALEPVVVPATAAATPASNAEAKAQEPVVVIDYDRRFAWDRPPRRSPGRMLAFSAAIALLAGALVAQIAWHYRDAIAAHLPSTRPALARLCALSGCTIKPLRDIAWLSIDASDLQADPAHKGLLILTATIRNRAPYAVAYPNLELTLTDSQDAVVVRRALAPKEYASPARDLEAGVAAGGEVAVKLYVDASATVQSGYRVYLFYA